MTRGRSFGVRLGPPGVGRVGSRASRGARPRRKPGRAPPATLAWPGRGQRAAARTSRLMYNLNSAKQSLSSRTGRRRQPQQPHRTCACGHRGSMSADASMCSKRACGGVRSAWDGGCHRQHAKGGACSMCVGGRRGRGAWSAARRSREPAAQQPAKSRDHAAAASGRRARPSWRARRAGDVLRAGMCAARRRARRPNGRLLMNAWFSAKMLAKNAYRTPRRRTVRIFVEGSCGNAACSTGVVYIPIDIGEW